MEPTLAPLLDAAAVCVAAVSLVFLVSRRLLVPFGRLFLAAVLCVLPFVFELEPSDLESLLS
jgi:hypothetical protein